MNTIKLGDGSVFVFTKIISVFTDNKPQDPDADHADMEAKLDGLTKQNASILDMLTSILNAISPSTTDTPEPDNSDKAQKGDTLQDFENLLN